MISSAYGERLCFEKQRKYYARNADAGDPNHIHSPLLQRKQRLYRVKQLTDIWKQPEQVPQYQPGDSGQKRMLLPSALLENLFRARDKDPSAAILKIRFTLISVLPAQIRSSTRKPPAAAASFRYSAPFSRYCSCATRLIS